MPRSLFHLLIDAVSLPCLDTGRSRSPCAPLCVVQGFWMGPRSSKRDRKNRGLVSQQRRGTIKVPPCSNVISTKQKAQNSQPFHAPPMATSPYEWGKKDSDRTLNSIQSIFPWLTLICWYMHIWVYSKRFLKFSRISLPGRHTALVLWG